jgi:endonuclease YncB( thermonuclease family)
MDSLQLDQLDREAINSIQIFNFDGQTFDGRVVDVIDGDTIVVIMNTTGAVFNKYHIRLVDIDVCELHSNLQVQSKRIRSIVLEFLMNKTPSGTSEEKQERQQIREALVQTPCIVKVMCRRFDKYGRILAEVKRNFDGESVGEYLLSKGLAKPYSGGTKPSHSKENI